MVVLALLLASRMEIPPPPPPLTPVRVMVSVSSPSMVESILRGMLMR